MKVLPRFLRQGIHKGSIKLTEPDGKVEVFDGEEPGPHLAIRITDPKFDWKLARNPELAVGEAYMDGRLIIEDGDVYSLFDLYFRNKPNFDRTPLQMFWQNLYRHLRRFRQHNPISRARANVQHHYDIGNKLYRMFLDPDMQYSCGYFPDGDESLRDAQIKKKRHLAAKLRLAPGQRVLDIGCGWGGLALYLASVADVEVVGITLSSEQIRIAKARARAAGLDNRVRFELVDYREVDERFDRVISVGMLEHVGAPFLDTYFRAVRGRLNDDGLALIHSISSIEPPGVTGPFLAKYIFPGGYSPSLSEVFGAVERVGLWGLDVEIWRKHYAHTLNRWRRNCMENRAAIVDLYDERFFRMWEFYLAASEASFLVGTSHVFQMQLGRERDAAPLSRDYITQASEAIAAREGDFVARIEAATETVFQDQMNG